MKITNQWLSKVSACSEAVSWYNNQKETDISILFKKAIKENKLDWANWTIDFSKFEFSDLLALIMGIFAISMSVAFWCSTSMAQYSGGRPSGVGGSFL